MGNERALFTGACYRIDPSLLSLGRISPTRLLMGHWFGNPFRVDPTHLRETLRSYCPEEVLIFAQSLTDINRICLILRASDCQFQPARAPAL
jgi:hypothetical protein